MRYQGGKSRISKPISTIINHYQESKPFVSLFCGSCAVESKVTGYTSMICNDKQFYLIAMLRACQSGWIPPENVTEDEWRYVRSHLDENPALSGFCGFGCSFGGKWFAGFARSKDRASYTRQSKNSLLRDMQTLDKAFFTNLDYRKVPIPYGAVIYADPPYADTTRYNHEPFDSDAFWNYMRVLVIVWGCTVFISEQKAPADFFCIWEKPFRRTLDVNKDNQFLITEKLFTYGGVINGLQNANQDFK